MWTVINDPGKQDRMILASELLRKRLDERNHPVSSLIAIDLEKLMLHLPKNENQSPEKSNASGHHPRR